MRKLTILTTAAAVAINAVSPAFATSLPSWSEVIKNVEAADKAGKFHGATRGKHSNTVFKPLSGADGFLFGNVLADDVPLPRVTDVRKVLEAAKQDAKPIIVASDEWILPSNPMLCEIAEQVKMTCGDFTRTFYAYMAKNDDGTYAGDEAANQTLSEIQENLVAKLEAMDLEVYAKNPVVEALEKQIASIKENNPTGQDELIAELQKTIDIMDKFYGTEVDLTAINEVLQDVDAHYQTMKQNYIDEAEAHAKTIQNHIDLLASYRATMKSAGVPVESSVQNMINALVSMRDIAQGKADYWKAQAEDWEGEAIEWKDTAEEWETSSKSFEKEAKQWKTDYNNQVLAWQEEKRKKELAEKQVTTLKSQLSEANAAKDSLQNQVNNHVAEDGHHSTVTINGEIVTVTGTNSGTYYTKQNQVTEGLNENQLNVILVDKEIDFSVNNGTCTKQCDRAFGPGWSLGGGGVITLYKKGGETQQIDIFPGNANGVNDYLAGEYNKKLAEGTTVTYDNGKVTVTFGALDSTEIYAVGEYVLTLPSNAAVESMLAKINLLTGNSEYDGQPQVPTDTKIQVHDYENNDNLYNVGSFSINHKIYNLTSIGAQAHLTGISAHEVETIKKIVEASYGKGYQDGYEDGYKTGWDDAIATAVALPSN